MKFIDLFSGIGGFRLGMEMAGHECVGHCEIDEFADKSYRAMHDVKGDEWYGSDIRAIKPGDLPEAECWCGGFPCQSFSVAGKRRGFEDMRGTLIFEVFRLAAERKPEILFLENVAGLLNHDGGRTFGTILCGLWELGYDVQWQVLNSKHFGVPQNRKRVFIIGYLGSGSGRKVLPIRQNGKEVDGIQRQYTNTLTSRYEGGQATGSYIVEGQQHAQEIKQIGNCMANGKRENPNQGRVYDTSGIAPTLTNMEGGGRQPFIEVRAVLTPDREEKRQNGRRFKEPGEEMFTLTAQDRHGVAIYDLYNHNQKKDGICGTLTANGNTSTTHCGSFGVSDGHRIRRLTPRECFRLQGFPDEYFGRAAAVNSDSQLYKQAGNSVSVPVIYEIAKRL